MIITCPKCQKRYLIEDTSLVRDGRTLQCISCQYQWFFTPPKQLEPDFQSAQVDLLGLHSSRNDSVSTFNYFTYLIILTVLIVASSFYFARHTLAHTFPALQPFYQTLGIKVKSPQIIEIQNVHPSIEKTKGNDQLIITGNFFNSTELVQTLSPIQITVKGSCGNATWFERTWVKLLHQNGNQCTIAKWYYYPSEKRLFPGEKIVFETHSPNTIIDPKSIQIKF